MQQMVVLYRRVLIEDDCELEGLLKQYKDCMCEKTGDSMMRSS